MFTTASATNKVVDTDLAVTYTISKQTDNSTTWYKVTRTATKQYRFVDIAASAIATVAAAKRLKYTRRMRMCISSTEDVYIDNCRSSVDVKRNDNGTFNLEINVDEEDSTHSSTLPSDPASLFTAENARDYDETAASVAVTSTSYDSSEVLKVYVTVSGLATSATVDDIQLYFNGSRVMRAIPYATGANTFRLEVSDWPKDDNTGTVYINGFGCSAAWSYVVPGVLLWSDSYAEAWEPPTSILHLDFTATLVGSLAYEGELSDVKFWIRDNDGGSEWIDNTQAMTITTDVVTSKVYATSSQTQYSTHGNFSFKATCGEFTSNIVNYTWDV